MGKHLYHYGDIQKFFNDGEEIPDGFIRGASDKQKAHLESLSHEFDFAIFKEDNLWALVDCDGLYYHGYLSDVNGKSVNNYSDDYRSLLIPENIRFFVVLEKNEEDAYRDILSSLDFSYDDYIKDIFNWCRNIGFPYPNYSNDILFKSYKFLVDSDINKFSMSARYGEKIINHFHRSIYSSNKKYKSSPLEAWNNDDTLIECIKNRIIYKGNNLDRSKVLGGLYASGIAPKVSIFNPYLSKYLVQKYLNDFETIFDPCSGFSGRMLGVTSLSKRYIGQDINKNIVIESNDIINFLGLNAQVSQKDLLLDKGLYDCLFTCMPYSDKEAWGEDIAIKSCDEWIDIIRSNYKCKTYLFVVDETYKYKDYIVETLHNKSHFSNNYEYVIKIEGEEEEI